MLEKTTEASAKEILAAAGIGSRSCAKCGMEIEANEFITKCPGPGCPETPEHWRQLEAHNRELRYYLGLALERGDQMDAKDYNRAAALVRNP